MVFVDNMVLLRFVIYWRNKCAWKRETSRNRRR